MTHPAPPAPAAVRRTMDLSDGQWHRMHPLTPLLKGGLVLIVVLGYLIANLRDRLIGMFMPGDFRDYEEEYAGDPIDWVVANNFVLFAVLGVVVVLAIIVGLLWLSWRFHAVRVAENAVEVRKGVVFRSQRRAPLDRIQGVNLTRPFLPRLIGLAKLEVVGAGTDANVQLEYLATANAERVRADILRWASGARRARTTGESAPALVPSSPAGALVQDFTDGVTGLVLGAEAPVAEPASVVHIPVSRMILSRVASVSTIAMLVFIGVLIAGAVAGRPEVLFGLVPAVIGFGGYYVSSLLKMLRYAIAPTPDGVRVVFGLTTTVTETIPPGRIHALQISQSFVWRWFGWYVITINRMSGRRADQQQKDPFTTLLPVGTADDVARVLRVVYPQLSSADLDAIMREGLGGPGPDDDFVGAPRRSWWVHLWAVRRAGVRLGEAFVMMRRGVLWRRLSLLPLDRAQSLSLAQGPLARATRLAGLQVDVVPGVVTGSMSGLDRDDVMSLFAQAETAVIRAGAEDNTQRWGYSVPAHFGGGAQLGSLWPTTEGPA